MRAIKDGKEGWSVAFGSLISLLDARSLGDTWADVSKIMVCISEGFTYR